MRLSTQTHTVEHIGAQCLQKVRSRVAMHGLPICSLPPKKYIWEGAPFVRFCHSPDGRDTEVSTTVRNSPLHSVPSALPGSFCGRKWATFWNFSFALLACPPAQGLMPHASCHMPPGPMPHVSVFVVVVRLSVCYDLYWFY